MFTNDRGSGNASMIAKLEEDVTAATFSTKLGTLASITTNIISNSHEYILPMCELSHIALEGYEQTLTKMKAYIHKKDACLPLLDVFYY